MLVQTSSVFLDILAKVGHCSNQNIEYNTCGIKYTKKDQNILFKPYMTNKLRC